MYFIQSVSKTEELLYSNMETISAYNSICIIVVIFIMFMRYYRVFFNLSKNLI